MNTNLVQVRRLVFRRKTNPDAAWEVFTIEPEELGQDSILSYSGNPRTIERASQVGNTSTPIPGTFEDLSASITVLADNAAIIGRVLDKWKPATYEGASPTAGQMLIGEDTNYCAANQPVSVIAQGVCDDGSAADIEFTRCLPQIDGNLEIGTSETPTVTFALNPQLYNKVTMSNDGYPPYVGRFGEYDLTKKMRLNVTTGEYEAVAAPEE